MIIKEYSKRYFVIYDKINKLFYVSDSLRPWQSIEEATKWNDGNIVFKYIDFNRNFLKITLYGEDYIKNNLSRLDILEITQTNLINGKSFL